MAVLLLGGAEDLQVRRVAAALEARGTAWQLLDTTRFPEHQLLSLDADGLRCEGQLLASPSAVYVRGLACHPLMPSLDPLLQEAPRRIISAMEEKRALLESALLLWQSQGTRLVNSPQANAQHSRKPLQLSLLHNAGLPVPAWLATNDPAALRGWVQSASPAVYKPLAGGATVRLVEESDLTDERLKQLAAAPVLFQRYIQGVSLRAYVVNQQVVAAAEIHSEDIDYRRAEGEVIPVTLSAEEEAIALRAAHVTGMPFAGVDFIRANGHSWLLEANPSPMFAVFEDKTGLSVASPLADFLAGA